MEYIKNKEKEITKVRVERPSAGQAQTKSKRRNGALLIKTLPRKNQREIRSYVDKFF